MLIEAPCRLGEKFTHHRSYSNPKEQYLLGIDLSIWHCNIDGVTLLGGPYKKGTVDFFERKDMDALPISFEVPERLARGAGHGTGEEVETTRDSAMRGNRVGVQPV